MLERKRLFAAALLKNIPLAAHIRRVLDERPGHRAPAARFLRELEDHLSEEEAERVLATSSTGVGTPRSSPTTTTTKC